MSKNKIKTILYLLAAFIGWRAVIQIISLLSLDRLQALPDIAYEFYNPNPWINNLPEWLMPFAKWDSGWYLSIAKQGYFYTTGSASNVVFFPLYPLLLKIISWFTNNHILLAGIIISHLTLFGAIYFLYKLTKIDFDEETSWRSVFYLLLFPTSFYLISVYTESLFLFLAILTFYLARKNKWWLAGISGLLASLTKPWGVAIVIPLAIEYLEQKNFSWQKIKADILSLCLLPLGTFVYMLFLKIKFGSFWLFAAGQKIWHLDTAFNPLFTLQKYWQNIFLTISDNLPYQSAISIDFAFFGSMLLLSLVIFSKLRKSYGIYALLATLIPAFSGILVSMSRYALVVFPLFILLAVWGKNKIINFIIMTLFATLLSFFLTLFVHDYWVA